jgi:hypothetical protein
MKAARGATLGGSLTSFSSHEYSTAVQFLLSVPCFTLAPVVVAATNCPGRGSVITYGRLKVACERHGQ